MVHERYFTFLSADKIVGKVGKVKDMFHSSVVPVALPISLFLGVIFFNIFHGLGADPVSSLAAAKLAVGITNLLIGIPKNILTGDILSLLVMRPISLVSGLAIISTLVGA